jgi:hypothetical protein
MKNNNRAGQAPEAGKAGVISLDQDIELADGSIVRAAAPLAALAWWAMMMLGVSRG